MKRKTKKMVSSQLVGLNGAARFPACENYTRAGSPKFSRTSFTLICVSAEDTLFCA